MRFNSLQFGKAMSAALFVLLLSVAGMKNAFAQIHVATLQHGDSISAFYGTNAFVQAHTAAQTGDIITLSSGSFMPCEITKAITLRGAGCTNDTVAGTNPTIITGSITGNVANDTTYLTIEGIWFSGSFLFGTLSQPKFIRCNFNSFGLTSSSSGKSMTNAQFINCRIRYFHYFQTSQTTFVNCIVWRSLNYSDGSGEVGNSIVAISSYLGIIAEHTNLSAIDCIIQNRYEGSSSTQGRLTGNSVVTDCIGIKNSSGYSPYNCTIYNCWTFNGSDSVFETFDISNYSWIEEQLLLIEEIASTCLGSDGTQVGIYGGIMPYTNTPSYMLRTNVSVPNHSNLDGTLNVEIEIIDEGE